MVDKKNYKIVVSGKTYTIASDESESHIMSVSKMVNDCIGSITEKMPNATLEQLAILTALQLSSTILHQKASLEQIDSQCGSLVRLISSQELS